MIEVTGITEDPNAINPTPSTPSIARPQGLSQEQQGMATELLRRKESGELTLDSPQKRQMFEEMMSRGPGLSRIPAKAPTTPEAQQSSPGLIEGITRPFVQFNSGFTEGVIADTLGAPVDLMTAAVEFVTGESIDEPFMGSQQIKQGLKAANITADESTSTAGRAQRAVGRAVGGGVTATGGAGVAANKLLQAWQKSGLDGKAVISTVDKIRDFTIQLAHTPKGHLLAAEAAIAAPSGLAGFVAEEAFPENPNLANAIAQISTSTGLAGAGFLLKKALKLKPFITGASDEALRERLGKGLSNLIKDPEALPGETAAPKDFSDNITEAIELEGEFPGAKLSLGQAAGSTPLANAESVLGQKSPVLGARLSAQQGQNALAVRRALEGESPGSSGNKEQFLSEIKQEVTRKQETIVRGIEASEAKIARNEGLLTTRTDRHIEGADDEAIQINEQISAHVINNRGSVTRADAGRLIRQQYNSAQDQLSYESQEMYDHLALSNKEIVPNEQTVAVVEQIRENITDFQRADSLPMKLIRQIEYGLKATPKKLAPNDLEDAAHADALVGAGETREGLTFQEFKQLRSNVLEELRDAGKKGERKKAHEIHKILDALDDDMESLATGGVNGIPANPELKEAYEAATKFYLTGKARLNGNAIRRISAHEGPHSVVDDADVAGMMFKDESSVDQFMQALGNRDGAIEAMRSFLKRDFYDKAMNLDGSVNIAQANAWIKAKANNTGIFEREEFAGLREEFMTLPALQRQAKQAKDDVKAIQRNPRKFFGEDDPVVRDLSAAERQLDISQKALTRHKREVEIGAVKAFIGDDAQGAASKILSSSTPVAEVKGVMSQLKTEDARQGFKQVMWDKLLQSVEGRLLDSRGDNMLQATTMHKLLRDKSDVMTELFGAARVQRMKRGAALLQANERTKLGRVGAQLSTDDMSQAFSDWGPLLSRYYALERGVVSMKWLIGDRLARAVSRSIGGIEGSKIESLLHEAFENKKVAQTLVLAARGGNRRLIKRRVHGHLVELGFPDREETADHE